MTFFAFICTLCSSAQLIQLFIFHEMILLQRLVVYLTFSFQDASKNKVEILRKIN